MRCRNRAPSLGVGQNEWIGLMRFLWTCLAALFLIEAWLWDVLGRAIARVLAFLPIEALKAALTRGLERLSAPMTLLVFLIPVAIVFPLKIAGLALMAHHRFIAGICVFALAKFGALGVTAFLFAICRDKLLTIGWFAKGYDLGLRLRAWAEQRIAPYRDAVRARVRELRRRIAAFMAERGGNVGMMARVAALRAKAKARLLS